MDVVNLAEAGRAKPSREKAARYIEPEGTEHPIRLGVQSIGDSRVTSTKIRNRPALSTACRTIDLLHAEVLGNRFAEAKKGFLREA